MKFIFFFMLLSAYAFSQSPIGFGSFVSGKRYSEPDTIQGIALIVRDWEIGVIATVPAFLISKDWRYSDVIKNDGSADGREIIGYILNDYTPQTMEEQTIFKTAKREKRFVTPEQVHFFIPKPVGSK